MSGAFDANTFLDTHITDANTRRPPINPGDYRATIGEVKPVTGEKEGKTWLRMDVPLKIEVPFDQQAAQGGAEVTLTHRVFIDLTDQGTIDNGPGRNRGQRQYRDACDLNKPGEAFSWRMLQGHQVLVQIAHELYNNETQERVTGVAKA